ncbi:MAG: VWA domain-containing protein [Betaproteobacteria bacterium]
MSFVWPQYLWLLLVVPILVGAYIALLRRKKVAVRFADLGIVKQAIGPGQAMRRHLPPALFLLALIAAIIAIARPGALVTLPSEGRTIVLAIDVSLSMRATDIQPSRIVAAQAAAREFVQQVPTDVKVAIVTFAGTALLVQPPTRDREELVAAIDRFQLQRHTAIGSGIIMSLATIFPDEGINLENVVFGNNFGPRGGDSARKLPSERGPLPKVEKKETRIVPPGSFTSAAIILLTDGRRTTGPDPLEAARMAANHGVRVFTVGFGTTTGAPIDIDGMSIFMRFDEESLKGIAGLTAAEYYHAASATDLKSIYENLNSRFALERKETEISALLVALAAVLAIAAGTLSLLWFGRVA